MMTNELIVGMRIMSWHYLLPVLKSYLVSHPAGKDMFSEISDMINMNAKSNYSQTIIITKVNMSNHSFSDVLRLALDTVD